MISNFYKHVNTNHECQIEIREGELHILIVTKAGDVIIDLLAKEIFTPIFLTIFQNNHNTNFNVTFPPEMIEKIIKLLSKFDPK